MSSFEVWVFRDFDSAESIFTLKKNHLNIVMVEFFETKNVDPNKKWLFRQHLKKLI